MTELVGMYAQENAGLRVRLKEAEELIAEFEAENSMLQKAIEKYQVYVGNLIAYQIWSAKNEAHIAELEFKLKGYEAAKSRE